MTPQERAHKVVEEVREHKMFNVDTDGTWERYIASAIKCALEDALPDANDLDAVVHELGIEDSDTTPLEAVRELRALADDYCKAMRRYADACQRTGICMSCATGELGEPCHDCRGTGWNAGAPVGYVSEENMKEIASSAASAACVGLHSIAQRWLALDGGSWHVDRHAADKAQLVKDTEAALAKAAE